MPLTHTLHHFVVEHDDLPAFHAGFLVVSFLAAAMFTSGVFLLMILAHMSLDIVKYREVHGFSMGQTIIATLRESLVDILFLVVALCFAVTFRIESGVAVMSGLLRAEETLIRAAGMLFPKLKIFYHFAFVVTSLKAHLLTIHPSISGHLRLGEVLTLMLLITCSAYLLVSPLLLSTDPGVIPAILMREITPGLV